MVTRTELSRRAAHDWYNFIESETRLRRWGRAINFFQHIIAIDRCSTHMLYGGGRPYRPQNRFLLPHFTLRWTQNHPPPFPRLYILKLCVIALSTLFQGLSLRRKKFGDLVRIYLDLIHGSNKRKVKRGKHQTQLSKSLWLLNLHSRDRRSALVMELDNW